MQNRTGQALGQYRIISSIGHGGFADVYLGEHIFLKTQAAIKVLHTRLASDTNEQFLAEARTIAHLVHPHIVRVHDFGIENTTPFLVMDYAPNGTLRQRHPRGITLLLALVVPYVKQIASALQFAHDRRLIHRDVKPENMLLGARNEVLLSDFGIATISQTSRSLSTQDISGTIAYMAPEQVQGKARPTSDQYSLGVIIYEWLVGRCPFQGSFAEIASQHMFAPPPSLRALNPSIPGEVEEVLMTALSKNAEARFARIEAFANAFEQASRIEPAGSYPHPSDAPTYIPVLEPVVRPTMLTPPPAPLLPPASQPQIDTPPRGIPDTVAAFTPGVIGQPTSKPSRKEAGITRRDLLIGAGVAVVLLGAGEGAWYLLTRKSTGPAGNSTSLVNHNTPTAGTTTTAPATTTSQPQPDPTGTTGPAPVAPLVHSGPSQEYTVAWSPDGTRVVSAGGSSSIEVWDAHNSALYFSMDASPAKKVLRVAWSHNTNKIASADSKGNIIIWDANNGNQLHSIAAHPNYYANGVAWSPDDTMIASCGGQTAAVWDAQTGATIASYTQHTSYVDAVAWSHNGTFIVSASEDGTAQVWYARTGQHYITYTGHNGKVLAVAWSPDDARIASGSTDNTARIWDATSGSTSLRYDKHSDVVASLDWSPDGQKIVTGSKDTTAQVWNPNNGFSIYTFPGHTFEVEGVAWAYDSRRVASASDDGTVQVWQIP